MQYISFVKNKDLAPITYSAISQNLFLCNQLNWVASEGERLAPLVPDFQNGS